MENIKLFENKKVRSQWNEIEEQWYFSIIDIIEILTESPRPRKYWNALKTKLNSEGSQLSQELGQLKLLSADGKSYNTDVATAEQLLRLIQSIPSPKAEPFKIWLAKVGFERIQEINDPSLSVDRAREGWQKMGRSEKWIQQRMTGQETRNKLTDYWKESGVEKSDEFAMLTNIIHSEWTGLTVKKHKEFKGLKSQNLGDHMSEAELIFTALAELSTRQIAETKNSNGINENTISCKKGGKIAKDARIKLEAITRKSVITNENFLPTKKQKSI
jgi:DNA-damage-inducible protein D